MRILIKFVIYFLIIASQIDYLWSRPVDSKRTKRQVVQPKWLSGPDSIFVDPNVHVTNQNLKEAAAIRAAIQKAVNMGTFAVNDDQPNVPIPTAEGSKPASQPRSKPASQPRSKSRSKSRTKPDSRTPARQGFSQFQMPQFEMPQFDMSQFNFTDFGFPEFELSQINPAEFFNFEQREAFLDEISRLWKGFWETSRKVLSTLHSQ